MCEAAVGSVRFAQALPKFNYTLNLGGFIWSWSKGGMAQESWSKRGMAQEHTFIMPNADLTLHISVLEKR